jgi:TetR/AcrR family transcriptional regulator, regulator of cefoperazone and chloramphenicol sensitivity
MRTRARTPAVAIDAATRDRLLATGTRLFAEHGYAKVTVRDICAAASANVAAINYHFEGKAGLYMEVLRTAVGFMRETTEAMVRAGEGLSAEAQLESFVMTFLQRVGGNRDGWIHQLMLHEMREPTPGLDLVIDQVIVPRFAYLRSIVRRLLDCDDDDPRVIACATSVQSQMMVVLKSPIASRLAMPDLTPDRIAGVASHIARFSLAGIRAIRDQSV